MNVAFLCIRNNPFKIQSFLSFSRIKASFCLNSYNSFKHIPLPHRNMSVLQMLGNLVVCVFYKASETQVFQWLSAGVIKPVLQKWQGKQPSRRYSSQNSYLKTHFLENFINFPWSIMSLIYKFTYNTERKLIALLWRSKFQCAFFLLLLFRELESVCMYLCPSSYC